MQRIIIALALALCVSTVVADFPGATGWSKTPMQVVQDNETTFTNTSGAMLTLANANPGELSIVSQSMNTNATGTNQYSWSTFWKKVDTKALTAAAATTLTFTMPAYVLYTNGYIVSIVNEADTTTGLTSIKVYQTPIAGGAALAKLTLTTGATNTTVVGLAGAVMIGKVVYVFYNNGNTTYKYTSYTVGSTVNATEYTLTSAADPFTLQVVWGESLGSSQVLAYWTEATIAKDAVVDVSKGTATAAAVTGVTTSHTCRVFATDKKLYGELCTTNNNGTITSFVKTNSTGLGQLNTFNGNNTNIASVGPYAGYLAIWYKNTPQNNSVTYGYELWDLSTFTLMNGQARKDYLTIDQTKVAFSSLRVPAGPIYGLLYNIGQNNLTYSGISVGAVLAGSYLTTILGFVMTIVAGLFLF